MNYVAPGVSAATISGGGIGSYFGAPLTNSIASDFSTIGGGAAITIQTNASYAVIGGGHLNTIQNLASESTIAGGGNNTVHSGANDSTISGGDLNSIETNSAQSTIGGGYNNTVHYLTGYATIGGGGINTIQNGAYDSVIGGGYNNSVTGGFVSAHDATIGGGVNNLNGGAFGTLGGGERNSQFGFGGAIAGGANNYAGGDYGAISGGQSNQISFFANYSTVGGGLQNTNRGVWSTIAGGYQNTILYDPYGGSAIGGGIQNTCGTNGTVAGGSQNYAGGLYSAVGGGAQNAATGFYSTVPGGTFNLAEGDYSFAGGIGAEAADHFSFVWSDGSAPSVQYFRTTAPGQFLITAIGGVGIGTNAPAGQLHVASPSAAPEFHITQQNSSDSTRLRMNVEGYQSWEMDVSPGPSPQLQFWNNTLRMYIDFSGNVTAASFNSGSDRNAKEHFSPISSRAVLDKVADLPISEWNFKNDPDTRHIGPMAQDFFAAFNVGPDDKHIATVDEGGVALAAIQGLNQKLDEKDAQIQELKRQNRDLARDLNELKTIVKTLAAEK